MGDPVQLVLSIGAAGALLYVLKLITDGKLHTSSEIDGLKQDKVDLLKVNRAQAEALKAANQQLAKVIPVIGQLRDEVLRLRGGSNAP